MKEEGWSGEVCKLTWAQMFSLIAPLFHFPWNYFSTRSLHLFPPSSRFHNNIYVFHIKPLHDLTPQLLSDLHIKYDTPPAVSNGPSGFTQNVAGLFYWPVWNMFPLPAPYLLCSICMCLWGWCPSRKHKAKRLCRSHTRPRSSVCTPFSTLTWFPPARLPASSRP